MVAAGPTFCDSILATPFSVLLSSDCIVEYRACMPPAAVADFCAVALGAAV